MKSPKLSRRDFLKIIGLTPLAFFRWPSVQTTFAEHASEEKLPNILVVVFDAWSARHLSFFGYPRRTTPNLEKLLQSATVYHRHYAGGNFTTPGTASLLTGVYPWTHRALHLHGTALERFAEQNIFSQLADRYHSFAYTHNPLAYMLLRQFNQAGDDLLPVSELCIASGSLSDRLLQGDFNAAYQAELLALRNIMFQSTTLFLDGLETSRREKQERRLNELYQEQFPMGLPGFWDKKGPNFMYFTLEQAVDWLAAEVQEHPTPFFGYTHFLPPHDPYNTRREFVGQFKDDWQPEAKPRHFFENNHTEASLNDLRREYDEFILYLDAEFARLYEALSNAGSLENTYIFLTSDHGEMFERGIYRHLTQTLYEPIIHVPLIVFQPGQTSRRDVYDVTNSVDLLPTFLQLAGKPLPEWCEGQPLPGFGPAASSSGRSVYTVEAKQNAKATKLQTATLALLCDEHKLIRYSGYPGYEEKYELYHLGNDPEELDDLAAVKPALADEMKAELQAALGKAEERLLAEAR